MHIIETNWIDKAFFFNVPVQLTHDRKLVATIKTTIFRISSTFSIIFAREIIALGRRAKLIPITTRVQNNSRRAIISGLKLWLTLFIYHARAYYSDQRHTCTIRSQFLARDSIICYRALYAIARPSVCDGLSVTRAHQSTTVEAMITQPSPQSSPMTLAFWRLTSLWNSKGEIGSGGAEWHRGKKNAQFSANKSPYLSNGAR